MSSSLIEIPESQVEITTDSHTMCRHNINLRTVVNKNYDVITGMEFEIPENITRVGLELMNQRVFFDIDMVDDLKKLPLYLSSCEYAEVRLFFEYDKSWVESNQEYIYVNEYKEVEELGEEVTIFDGYEYHTGKIVNRDIVATGNKIKKITKGVMVTIPKVILNVTKQTPRPPPFSVPIRQKINITNLSESGRQNLKNNLGLIEIDEKTGYITNEIRYISGLIGLWYTFD